ncbi:MAG TPA: sulfotransferase domain-containing protein [Gemmatimonadaceae bacterium]|nr:sulfotransferase domain-containing protein [Gemmatimonadaceae bacterium]
MTTSKLSNTGTGPDFLCIGMQKAGTKWLYDSLRWCPGFWMPPIREMHFFDREFLEPELRANVDRANLARSLEIVSPQGGDAAVIGGRPSPNPESDLDFAKRWVHMVANGYRLADYRALFTSKGRNVSGDVTPAYSGLSEREVKTVKAAFPELRIVLIVRDPISRAWSSFNMHIRKHVMSDTERRSPRSGEILREKASVEMLSDFLSRSESAGRSFPSVSYERWASAFGQQRVHVTFFPDIAKRPVGVLEEICSFLGVSPEMPPVPARNVKGSVLRTEMGEAQAAYLRDFFREEYRRIEGVFPRGLGG